MAKDRAAKLSAEQRESVADRLETAALRLHVNSEVHRREVKRLLRAFEAIVRQSLLDELIAESTVEYGYQTMRGRKALGVTTGGGCGWDSPDTARRHMEDERARWDRYYREKKQRNPNTYRLVSRTIGPWVPERD